MGAALNLAWLRVIPREPAMLFTSGPGIAVIRTGSLGFAGAAEGDRARWISSFRRLLDGLDAPLQVLIEVLPGTGSENCAHAPPLDFDDMRGADMCFVERLAQSASAHRFETSLITPETHAKRLAAALQEIGVKFEVAPPATEMWFGEERANHHR